MKVTYLIRGEAFYDWNESTDREYNYNGRTYGNLPRLPWGGRLC